MPSNNDSTKLLTVIELLISISVPPDMITVAIFNIFVVFYAFIARNIRTEFWLKFSFVLIFLFLAFRYNYGNDYFSYLKKFLEINRVETIDYFDKYWGFEAGWVFLCRLFGPLGFFAMTAVLALFNCIVYYRFIKKYVPPDYYWLAVFLYVFNPNFMLIHSSAMRQSFAISLFLFAIDYIYKKDALRYILCVGLAALFHTSALILLPVYLLGLFDWKINKLTAVGIFSLFMFMFLYGNTFLPDINQFISVYFLRYEVYEGGVEIGTGLGLIFNSFLFALILYYERIVFADISLLFKIAILSYFVIPLTLSIMMLGRVGMYFQPATLAVFPVIFSNIKNPILLKLTLALLVFITLYSFYGFFQSDVWRVPFGNYQTIFSAPEIY